MRRSGGALAVERRVIPGPPVGAQPEAFQGRLDAPQQIVDEGAGGTHDEQARRPLMRSPARRGDVAFDEGRDDRLGLPGRGGGADDGVATREERLKRRELHIPRAREAREEREPGAHERLAHRPDGRAVVHRGPITRCTSSKNCARLSGR
jgi:hypothetical protein